MRLEHPLVVIVEAEDHAGPHLHPGVLDAADLVDHAAAAPQVLQLFGLAQRVLVGAFDPDKHRGDIGLGHQLHQLVVIGEIHRGFGDKGQRKAVRLLPIDHVAQHFLDRALVADQVVVDDEDDRQVLLP